MKQLKYLFIILLAFTFSCVTKTQINIDEDIYIIYSKIIDDRTGLERRPWYDDPKIADKYTQADSFKLFLKYKDSIKAYLKKKSLYVLIKDSTIDINDEMPMLKYSVNNNKLFFKEYFNGDSSFKKMILKWKPLKFTKEKIISEKLKPTFQYSVINEISKNPNDLLIRAITLSNVVFDKSQTKAILYVVDGSGILYFLEKIKSQWKIKETLVTWQE